MSKFTMTDAYILIAGTNISDHTSSVTVEDTAEQIDFTTFGPSGYKQWGQGMRDCKITATLFSDFAASSIHTIFQPLYQTGGTFSVEVRPTSAGRSATNPAATMTGKIYNYGGIAGAVGAASTMQVEILNAGTAGIVWATA